MTNDLVSQVVIGIAIAVIMLIVAIIVTNLLEKEDK